MGKAKNKKYFFVDESGDLTLFNKKGQLLVGNKGVSDLFMVGTAIVKDPELVNAEFDALRKKLLNDPYFKGVPSFNPERKKTAIAFHAKDDLPEVRREVFIILKNLDIKVIAAIKRKKELATIASQSFKHGSKVKLNKIYSNLVSRIFRNLLHKSDENIICFAHRGTSTKTAALQTALSNARKNFTNAYGKEIDTKHKIICKYPHQEACLQTIDYYLWALQRLYIKGEDRYFNYIEDNFRLIMDIDDKRNNDYGEWYSPKNQLTLTKIKPV